MRATSDFQEIAEVDILCIGITEGFDIGIAKRHLTSWERWPVGKWRKKLEIKGDLEQGENKKLPFLPSMLK